MYSIKQENKTNHPVLINQNNPKQCNILYRDKHHFLCKGMYHSYEDNHINLSIIDIHV